MRCDPTADLRGASAALVLAAGSSRRMGQSNKLLVDLQGEPLLRHTLRAVGAFGLGSVLVVTGHEALAVASLARSAGYRVHHNANCSDGMGSSIAAGVAVLPQDCRAVLICLADMPLIRPETVGRLMGAMNATADMDSHIAVPTHNGNRGHPVLFGRRFFPDLMRLKGDRGARDVLRENAAYVLDVGVEDPAIHFDIDSQSDFETFQAMTADRRSR